jgi:hypothetical protein
MEPGAAGAEAHDGGQQTGAAETSQAWFEDCRECQNGTMPAIDMASRAPSAASSRASLRAPHNPWGWR